jgi:hypothetical protein
MNYNDIGVEGDITVCKDANGGSEERCSVHSDQKGNITEVCGKNYRKPTKSKKGFFKKMFGIGDRSGFGKKKRYNVPGSACNKLSKRVCHSNPNCSYTKRGCRRRKGTRSGGLVFEGPSLAFGHSQSRFGANACGNPFLKRDPKSGRCILKSVSGLSKAVSKKAGQGALMLGQGAAAARRALGQGA